MKGFLNNLLLKVNKKYLTKETFLQLKDDLKDKFPISVYPGKQDYEIVYAFTSGGVDYYQYADISNIPPMRGIKSMVFYEEMRMKVSLPYLQLHYEAQKDIFDQKKIKIYDANLLNEQLGQRLNMAIDTELIYKISSVVFFDMKENVADYDYDYNNKKVLHWKKDPNSFFLLKPVQDLLPFLKDVDENFLLYSQMQEKLNQVHLGNLSRVLPSEKTRNWKDSSFFSVAVMGQK